MWGVHLKNIYKENELKEETTTEIFSVVQTEGGRNVNRNVKFYNLDAIIAVGYRVNSKRATAFRIWATKVLKEYMVKGFALDDDRFKRGRSMDHFKELLERIREIRVSERVFYQQIKDIYRLSEDYDPKDDMTIAFFKKVQNKLLYAVSRKTAAELMYYGQRRASDDGADLDRSQWHGQGFGCRYRQELSHGRGVERTEADSRAVPVIRGGAGKRPQANVYEGLDRES